MYFVKYLQFSITIWQNEISWTFCISCNWRFSFYSLSKFNEIFKSQNQHKNVEMFDKFAVAVGMEANLNPKIVTVVVDQVVFQWKSIRMEHTHKNTWMMCWNRGFFDCVEPIVKLQLILKEKAKERKVLPSPRQLSASVSRGPYLSLPLLISGTLWWMLKKKFQRIICRIVA